ncbi:uncharacterized protein L3040_008151 [Drepanopeziza brunnea f. sp. 'multigermtubi']|nr:hypothetical protein L3040_008151 [Drepanopeziza brunnea f. sp. 'multigermtubi']
MFASFTITQPFLGAPLQFQPALGSKELEALVNAYVIGNGSKSDKLSVVTVEFFNLATVDLNTGALTRTYEVFFAPIAFEQSSTESQSSGYSPPIFTPSPASSATYGSMSTSTPNVTPTRMLGSARVTKKSAKVTKKPKIEEARLPGFSIMTKDGVDITTTAGRGTKTKEQREHAHLMRIMKACDACKRKKIRCDPSHRRSPQKNMAQTPTSSTTKTSSTVSNGPSPQYESSGHTSSLTRQSTQATQGAFTPLNAIDDFILFPEDASWNPEMSQTSLGQFNYDLNDMNLTNLDFPIDHELDFSFDQQAFMNNFRIPLHQQPYDGPQNYSSTPHMAHLNDTPGDMFDLDQLLDPNAFGPEQTRPHPAGNDQHSSPTCAGVESRSSMSAGTNTTLISSSSDWSLLETTVHSSPGGNSPLGSASCGICQQRASRNQVASNVLSQSTSAATAMSASNVFCDSGSGYDAGSGIVVDPSDPLDVPLARTQVAQRDVYRSLNSLAQECRKVTEQLRRIESAIGRHGSNATAVQSASSASSLDDKSNAQSHYIPSQIKESSALRTPSSLGLHKYKGPLDIRTIPRSFVAMNGTQAMLGWLPARPALTSHQDAQSIPGEGTESLVRQRVLRKNCMNNQASAAEKEPRVLSKPGTSSNLGTSQGLLILAVLAFLASLILCSKLCAPDPLPASSMGSNICDTRTDPTPLIPVSKLVLHAVLIFAQLPISMIAHTNIARGGGITMHLLHLLANWSKTKSTSPLRRQDSGYNAAWPVLLAEATASRSLLDSFVPRVVGAF